MGVAQQDPFFLDGLVVTASPTPRPARAVASHVTVLQGDELRRSGLTRVSEALRLVPGVSLVENGSFGSASSIFMRGGESDYVLVLVDGVQVNQPGGAFDFSSLTLADVQRIEVVQGGASALYGSDAVSGVVNIITGTGGEGLTTSAMVRAGSYGRLDWGAELRGGGARTGYSLSLQRTTTDGILAFNNRHVNTVFQGAVRLTPDEATRARLSLRLGDRSYHYPTDGTGNVVDRNSFTYGNQATVGLNVSRRLGSGFAVEALLAHHQTDGGTDDRQDGPADTLGFYGFESLDHMKRTSVDLRGHLDLGVATATVGWELEDERQRSFTESTSGFGTSSDRSRYQRGNQAGYAHLTAEGRDWAVNVGGRLDDNERFGRFTSWQVGASWHLLPDLRLRAAASRAVKEPTFYENFATGFARGNPELDPERARSWEVGVDAELPLPGLALRATWFRQRMDDLIQYTFTPPEPGDPNFFNLASARSRGLETALEYRSGGFHLTGSWTWLDTEVTDPGADEGQGPAAAFVEHESLLRRPARSWSLAVDQTVAGDLVLTGQLRRVGERDDRDFSTVPASRVTLPAYAVVALGVRFTAFRARGNMPGLRVGIRADNLLDRTYQEVVGFPAPGRRIDVTARLRLGALD
jgi:vitamin B12 transporter